MQDAWDCYDQPYSLFVGDGSEDSIQHVLDDTARVLSKSGWQKLIDDYEPDIYRLAYCPGGFDVKNKKTRVGTFDITLRCRPERFLRVFDSEMNVQKNDTVYNPTVYIARPLIHITGSGNGTLTVGSTTVTIKNMVDYLNIDCDKQDIYRQPTENRNSCMEGDFPLLYPNSNVITYTGGITSVSITPKFWIL